MKSSLSSHRTVLGQQLYDDLQALPSSQRLTAEQLEVVYALAYAHVMQGQYAQALPIFGILSTYGPTRRHYLAGLALCLEKCERYEDAIQIYSLLIVLYPEGIEAALQIAECQIALNHFDDAKQELDRVLRFIQESGSEHSPLQPRAELLYSLAEQCTQQA